MRTAISTLAIAATLSACSTEPGPEQSHPLKAKLDAHAPALLAEHEVAAVGVAYIADGKVQWTAVYGERAPGSPATKNTLFNVASMAKPVAAEVVLRLASDNAIALDASMAEHWVDPDIAGDPRHELLTPGIALRHRTGFPNWRDRKTGLQFKFDPGTDHGYSGEGYEYVARFVENATGRPFQALVDELAFGDPSKSDATYTPNERQTARLALPNGPDNEWGEADISSPWSAADNLYVTVGQYAAFMAAVMRNEGLTTEIAAQRHTVVQNLISGGCPLPEAHCPEVVGSGLGWEILTYGEETSIRHGGQDWGEQSLGYFIPEKNMGVLIITNDSNGMKVIRDISAMLCEHEAFNALLELQAR